MASTFVLGIDGSTWRILNKQSLPTFEALIDQGVNGTLRSTYPPMTFPAWKCLTTGKNPGKLGVFGFSNFDRNSKTNNQNSSLNFAGAEIWDYLTDRGMRSSVINVPTTYPPHDINGVMIAGPNAGRNDYVTPESREADIKDTGYRPLSPGDRLALKAGGNKTIRTARRVVKSRFDVAESLYESDDPHLLFMCIYCTDTVQHYYWEGSEVRDVYRYIDKRLNQLLRLLRNDVDEWNVVIVSDHGFQPIKGALNLDTWLEQEGFLVGKEDDMNRGRFGLVSTQSAYSIIKTLSLERLVDIIPERIVHSVADRLARADSVSVVDSVNWDESDAVFLNGGIYVLNERVKNELERRLLGATDSEGDALFDHIRRGDNVYEGPKSGEGPDFIPYSNHYKLLGFGTEGNVFESDDDWIAGHEMDGIFIASGPDFNNLNNVNLDIYDFAPTLLHAIGLRIPCDMDGRVRSDVLVNDDEVIERSSIDYNGNKDITDVDNRRIQDRLEQLGYIE